MKHYGLNLRKNRLPLCKFNKSEVHLTQKVYMSFSIKKRIFLLLTGFLLSSTFLKAELFEGIIKFHQYTSYDTTLLRYSIRNNKIRINKYDNQRRLIECLLVDKEKEKVTALNPRKKLYRPLEPKKIKKTDKTENYKVIRRGNHKKINGVKCYQWRVRSRKNNTEIAYWVAVKKFDFFHDLIDLLERTNKIYDFFSEIPDNKGMFPLLSVERTLLRKERKRLTVAEITRKSMDESLFKIPEDYRMIRE